jgi:hypothetical protein
MTGRQPNREEHHSYPSLGDILTHFFFSIRPAGCLTKKVVSVTIKMGLVGGYRVTHIRLDEYARELKERTRPDQRGLIDR